jgi:hypothetical protein
VSVRGIYRLTVRTYWRQAGFLVLLGAIVFVPLSLLDALANEAQEIDTGEITKFELAALIAGLAAQGVTSMLGEVFYSGAVAVTLAVEEDREKPTLRAVARRIAWGRLIVVDIVFAVAVGLGLELFVVPGFLIYTWLALSGPIVELEHAGIKESFVRSVRLVSGNFWAVFCVLVPITLASAALSAVVVDALPPVFGSTFVSDWIGEAASSIAISPFYAVAAVLITLELSAARPARAPTRPVAP